VGAKKERVAGRRRVLLVALLCLAVVVGTGVAQAGVGESPDREALGELLDRLTGGRGDSPAGDGDGDGEHTHRDRCPKALEDLKLCQEHVEDPQADFKPFDGDSAPPARERASAHERAHDHGQAHTHAARGSVERPHATGPTAGKTTLEQTIAGEGDPDDGFQHLRLAGGEARVVREELAEAKKGRAKRRRSLLYVGQTTDWQLADEESPARVEFLDIAANPPFPSTVSAAWRPQEALGAAAIEQSVRQLNRFAEAPPVPDRDGREAPMDFVLMTGDQADNQQLNETDWVVRLLEGGPIDPNSGTDPSSCPPGLRPSGQTADPELYAGVQDFDDYVEGQQFYDPDEPAGPKYSDWPTYPGLMDRAQEPFQAQGLDVPSYVVMGNHDALAQGNEKAIAPFEQVGIGCVKPLVPAADLTEVADILDPTYLAGILQSDPEQVMLVPPDIRRQYVNRAQYKQRFDTGAQEDAHGFALVDPQENTASNGAATYYSFRPKPGIRLIGLETNCDGGVVGPSSNGNIDDPQFQWLRGELEEASKADELVIAFGHHPIRSLDCDIPDETPPECTVDDSHGHDVNPGCDEDPRDSQPLHTGADLTALFHEYPHVIAYVAGHTHENTIADFDRPDGGPGDFWGIETASLVDWPPQNRLIQLMNNCDGTLSIFGTTLDSAAPATAPSSGAEAGDFTGSDLGSVSRTLAYNDPQAGAGTGEGAPADRNVELLLEDPRRDPPSCKRKTSSQPPDDGSSPGPSADASEAQGSLPFTGLLVGTLALIGAALLANGFVTRRLAARRER
jgi:metallophosphoesterase (TIGR03767 family)